MEYISGETHYIPPPLAKGEILTGIAGFLENDVVKKRPKALNIYGPYNDQQELEIDLLGAPVPKTAKSTKKQSTRSTTTNSNITTTTITTTDSDEEEDEGSPDDSDLYIEGEGGPLVTFDVQRLPFAYGTKTTEALIDALFNPVITSEKRQESPFTVYVPPSPTSSPGITPTVNNLTRNAQKADMIGLGLSGMSVDMDGTITARPRNGFSAPMAGKRMTHRQESSSTSSIYSTGSSSASVMTGSGSMQSRSQSLSLSTSSDVSATPTPAIPPISTQKTGGTPEGRVVVDHSAAEDLHANSSSGGGMKGWWKRHTSSRPPTPTLARPQGVKA